MPCVANLELVSARKSLKDCLRIQEVRKKVREGEERTSLGRSLGSTSTVDRGLEDEMRGLGRLVELVVELKESKLMTEWS